jgi:hypothetical protein
MPTTNDAAYKKCEQENNSESSDESDEKNMWNQEPCVFQCYFKEKGAINEDGSVNKEKVVELAVANANGDAEWSDVMRKSAESCYEKGKIWYNFIK